MYSKIKEIRTSLGLSEAQISSLLNISSYKYRRYENGSLILTVEVLVLLSIIYDVSVDLLVFDKFSIDMILETSAIKKLMEEAEQDRFKMLKNNMCKYCVFDCDTINYRVVKNLLVHFLSVFSEKLYSFRCAERFEVLEVSLLLHINVEHYVDLENGKKWPTVYELIGIASIFSVSINELFEIKREIDL